MRGVLAQGLGERWLEHMRRGEMAEAWRVGDAVLRARAGRRCDALPRHLQWIWSGERLEGKRVLVRCYHGLGDTIQFVRYAPLLRAIAARVIVWAQPALLPLLRSVRGIDELLALHDGAPDVERDAEIEVMELPHAFRTTLATIPARAPYVRVLAQARTARAERARRGEPLDVGLVWRAGNWDGTRSIPPAELAPLAEIPGVRLHALQQSAARAELPRGIASVLPADAPLETARAIRSLDLVISVDTFPAHLAGALARRVRRLLPARADWRWMEERADSPWDPTMRLFRQRRAGEWAAWIEVVAARPSELVGARADGAAR